MVSPGSYLNNANDSKKRCSWQEKYSYVKASKFTIAGDSIRYPGFVTEKIVQPFQNHSIPIYFGSTRIYEDFNKEAFVCCENEDDIDRAIEQVKYLDTHDEAYINMLMQHPLVVEDYTQRLYEQLDEFLVNIFSQDINNAYRRVRYFCAQQHESYLKDYMKKYNRTPNIVRRIKNKLS